MTVAKADAEEIGTEAAAVSVSSKFFAVSSGGDIAA